MLTWCDCDNITNPYAIHKEIAVTIAPCEQASTHTTMGRLIPSSFNLHQIVEWMFVSLTWLPFCWYHFSTCPDCRPLLPCIYRDSRAAVWCSTPANPWTKLEETPRISTTCNVHAKANLYTFKLERKRRRFQPIPLFPICVFMIQRQRSKKKIAFAQIYMNPLNSSVTIDTVKLDLEGTGKITLHVNGP